MDELLQSWYLVALAVLVLSVIFIACIVVPLGIICRKAGFSPWLSLLNCIPFGTVVLLYMLAVAEWKRRPMFVPAPASPDREMQHVTGPRLVVRETRPMGHATGANW